MDTNAAPAMEQPLPPALCLPSKSPRRNRSSVTMHRASTVCFSEWSHKSTPGSSKSGNEQSSKASQPQKESACRFGAKKKSHALQAKDLWHLILNYVDSEQKETSGNNLGVKSGTCVVDDLVMQRVQRQLLLLHTLCVEHNQAAEVVGQLARSLTHDQLQRLQVLCDETGHTDLSDFIRLSVFNTADPFVKRSVDGPGYRTGRAVSRARTPKSPPMSAPSPPRRELNPPLLREETIRFAGFLPPDHPLAQVAYALHHSREGWGRYSSDHDLQPVSDQGSFTSRSSQREDSRPDSNASSRNAQQQQSSVCLDQQQQQLRQYQQQGYQQQQWVYQQQLEAGDGQKEEEEEVPLWTDTQRRWSQKNHTIIRDELFNPVVVASPLGLYGVLPDFKQKILDAQKKAEATKPLPHLLIPSYTLTDAPSSPSLRSPSPSKPYLQTSVPGQRPKTTSNPMPTSPTSAMDPKRVATSPNASYYILHSPTSQSQRQGNSRPPSSQGGTELLSQPSPGSSPRPTSSRRRTQDSADKGAQAPVQQSADDTHAPGAQALHHVPTLVGHLKQPIFGSPAKLPASPSPSSTPAQLPPIRPPSTHRLAVASSASKP